MQTWRGFCCQSCGRIPTWGGKAGFAQLGHLFGSPQLCPCLADGHSTRSQPSGKGVPGVTFSVLPVPRRAVPVGRTMPGSPAGTSQPARSERRGRRTFPPSLPAAAPAQGWQGTREIKQAISKAKRKAAIWALTDRSFNEQREFSREAGEMQQSE